MLVKVVPVFAKMYDGMGLELPAATATIMAMSDFLRGTGGKLILFLKNKRQAKMELSFDDELKKIINIERNRQLDQFSSIYYKKVEINTKIYDN